VRTGAEVGKVTFKSNSSETLSNESLLKNNGDKALRKGSLENSNGDEALNGEEKIVIVK
jgi:hypothetical protein